MIQRKRNSRPTYEVDSAEPTSQNYYPVNSQIFIKDDSDQLAVLVDRSQGGSSLKDGCLELMLHRRLLDDDAFGVGEALNEQAYGTGLVAVGKHLVLLGQDITKERKEKATEMFYQPLIVFQKTVNQKNVDVFPNLNIQLPENVHILTLRKILQPDEPESKFVLLRLEHLYQVGEHPDLSTPATVYLTNMFSEFFLIEWARETLLGGNLWKEEGDRFMWSKEEDRLELSKDEVDKLELNKRDGESVKERTDGLSGIDRITMLPMEIRTFILKLTYL